MLEEGQGSANDEQATGTADVVMCLESPLFGRVTGLVISMHLLMLLLVPSLGNLDTKRGGCLL